jgi:hypothetical protein
MAIILFERRKPVVPGKGRTERFPSMGNQFRISGTKSALFADASPKKHFGYG